MSLLLNYVNVERARQLHNAAEVESFLNHLKKRMIMDKILLISNNKNAEVFYSDLIHANIDKTIAVTHLLNCEDIIPYLSEASADCIIIENDLSDHQTQLFLQHYLKTPQPIPVILIGEKGSEKEAVSALKLGVYDYLTKDELKPKQLQKAIKEAIEKNHLLEKIQAQESEMRYLALHDHLTNIPNRRNFEALAEKALSRAKRIERMFSILIIDIDHFKSINDSLGHHNADILLQKLTKRLSGIIRKNDTLARIGGDEFAIILDLIKDESAPEKIAQRILDCLKTTFYIENQENLITVSIGIATYSIHGDNITDLMKNADTALYEAKKSGRNIFRLYSKEYKESFIEYLTIENAVHEALKKKQFHLCFQPIFNHDGSLHSHEVLLRWHNEKLKNYTPDKLIPIIEETGLIQKIGEWVLVNAFKAYSNYPDKNKIKLSINLSPIQLNDQRFFDTLEKYARKYGIPTENVIFELTETAIINDTKNAIRMLNKLKESGYSIFIDDFGAGYTSLNLIRTLPISGLKVDKLFIKHIDKSAVDFNMAKSIIDLGKNIGLTVVVEGVETEAQYKILNDFHDIKIQGFFLGKPDNFLITDKSTH